MIKPAGRHVLYPVNQVCEWKLCTPLLQPLEGHTCCDITRSDSLDMDWLRKAYNFHVLDLLQVNIRGKYSSLRGKY